MTRSKVEWYSLGFNTSSKQGTISYGLEGDGAVQYLDVSAAELTALGDMFRNEAQINYDTDTALFETDREVAGHGVPRTPQPKYP